jgi:predicted dehydrogenase
MTDFTRRDFLSSSAFAAAGLMASVHVAPVRAAEDGKDKKPVRIALMGLAGRGRQLISNFVTFPEVEFAYLCDPDADVLPGAVKQITDKGKKEPKTVADFRTALDDKDVDVLVCAAPDHWHALATIWGCQAGKDVYCEKPCSHNIEEGRRMIEAARYHKRVVGCGTQRRSGADYQDAVKAIQSGKIGKVSFVRCWITSTRPNIGKEQPVDPPKNLDFSLWAGPGSASYYKKNLVHYHWHWRWDYGTGECGNNGIHALDIARWGLGVDTPNFVTCGGAKYHFEDDQETPDTQLATFDFDNAAIQWEHRTWSKRGIDGADFGIAFYGSDATLVCGSSGYTIYEKEKAVETRKPASRDNEHIQNFLDCLISREKPNADVEICHHSTQLCHLANIAWRTRSTLQLNPKSTSTDFIQNNPAAMALVGREYRKGFELPKIG